MASNLDELRKDIEEIRRICDTTTRPRVASLLQLELRRLETDLAKRESDLVNSPQKNTTDEAKAAKSVDASKYVVQLRNYAWDQSENFLKFYITCLSEMDKLTAEDVKCSFFTHAFDLQISHHSGKTYRLNVANLLHNIIPDQSHVKVKKDSVLVMMRKEKGGEHWDCVTKQEEQIKAKKNEAPKYDDTGDPTAGLMGMLKKMYEDGDDDMKRTIAKAWTESRDKQSKDPLANMDI